jgi:hypothetical protein
MILQTEAIMHDKSLASIRSQPAAVKMNCRKEKKKSKTNKERILLTLHLYTGSFCNKNCQQCPNVCSAILISPQYLLVLEEFALHQLGDLWEHSSQLLPVSAK